MKQRSNVRRRDRAIERMAAGLAIGAAVVASCGIGGDGGGFEELSEAEKSRIAEEFRDCMAEGGLDAKVQYQDGLDIEVSGDASVSDEEMLQVEAGCEPILSGLDQGRELDPEDEARLADAMLEVQKCLADAGFVVTLSENGIDLNSDDQAEDFDEAAYAEQEDQCFREADSELYEKYENSGG